MSILFLNFTLVFFPSFSFSSHLVQNWVGRRRRRVSFLWLTPSMSSAQEKTAYLSHPTWWWYPSSGMFWVSLLLPFLNESSCKFLPLFSFSFFFFFSFFSFSRSFEPNFPYIHWRKRRKKKEKKKRNILHGAGGSENWYGNGGRCEDQEQFTIFPSFFLRNHCPLPSRPPPPFLSKPINELSLSLPPVSHQKGEGGGGENHLRKEESISFHR